MSLPYSLVKCKIVSLVRFASLLCVRTTNEYFFAFADLIIYWYNLNDLPKIKHLDLMNIITILRWKVWEFRKCVVLKNESFHHGNATDGSCTTLSNVLKANVHFCC